MKITLVKRGVAVAFLSTLAAAFLMTMTSGHNCAKCGHVHPVVHNCQ